MARVMSASGLEAADCTKCSLVHRRPHLTGANRAASAAPLPTSACRKGYPV